MKHVRAYFKSEDDAEAVHASLNKLNVDDVLIDEMPEDSEPMRLLPVYNQSSGSAIANTGIFSPVDGQEQEELEGGEEVRSYLLEFDVKEDDFQEAVNILYKNDGYVDQTFFE